MGYQQTGVTVHTVAIGMAAWSCIRSVIEARLVRRAMPARQGAQWSMPVITSTLLRRIRTHFSSSRTR
jgi:hypothetical protein